MIASPNLTHMLIVMSIEAIIPITGHATGVRLDRCAADDSDLSNRAIIQPGATIAATYKSIITATRTAQCAHTRIAAIIGEQPSCKSKSLWKESSMHLIGSSFCANHGGPSQQDARQRPLH